MMRLVHPILGVRIIESVDDAPALTEQWADWTISDEADAEFTHLWLELAERLSRGAQTRSSWICVEIH